MASVKIIHYTHKKYSDGTSPLIIQVIKNSVTRKKAFAQIFDYQFDGESRRVKKHANASTINDRIVTEFNRIEKIILSGRDFDIQTIFKNVNQKEKELTFWDVCESWLISVKAKNFATWIPFDSQIRKFKDFCNNDYLKLEDIDTALLSRYYMHLVGLKNKVSTINVAFKLLRVASKHGSKVLGLPKNEQLLNFSVPSAKNPVKTKLTKEEFQRLKNAPYENGTKMREIIDMFVLAVYLRGMRVTDVIQLKNEYFKGDRLNYTSNKNKSNFSIKLIPEALEIINKYKSDREYLFSFYKFVSIDIWDDEKNNNARQQHLKSITANINGKLKRIAEKIKLNKKLSSHIAKHTFGKMAIDAIKDTNVRMDLMGHTSIEAHETYVRELSKEDELDNAADQIFGS